MSYIEKCALLTGGLEVSLSIKEFLNDIFFIIMLPFLIQLNYLSKFYVALKNDPCQTLSSISPQSRTLRLG